jgi:hypothetical protein
MFQYSRPCALLALSFSKYSAERALNRASVVGDNRGYILVSGLRVLLAVQVTRYFSRFAILWLRYQSLISAVRGHTHIHFPFIGWTAGNTLTKHKIFGLSVLRVEHPVPLILFGMWRECGFRVRNLGECVYLRLKDQ